MSRRRMLFFVLLVVILAAGCQAAEPQTVSITEFVEVTRIVEVPAESITEFVEVTRIVEVPAESDPVEALSVFPSLKSDVRTYSSSNGREYVVYVILPFSYDSAEQDYPVVYVTDGDFYALSTAMAAGQLAFGQEMPEVIVVGIGYGGDVMNSMVRREEDMTPEGTDSFLQFIEDELIPDIETHYRATASQRTLAGHSLGGAFTLYAMFKTSETFDYFIASSPSCPDACQEQQESYAKENDALDVRVYASTGELDPEVTDVLEVFWASVQASDYSAFDGEMFVLNGETHLSARPRAFTSGLKWVFSGGE